MKKSRLDKHTGEKKESKHNMKDNHQITREKSKRDADVQNRLVDSVGEGEGGMIWENGIETCILACKKRIASLGSTQDTGCLGLVHWDDPERWYGEGGGRGVQDWELRYTRGRFMLMYGKTNTIL